MPYYYIVIYALRNLLSTKKPKKCKFFLPFIGPRPNQTVLVRKKTRPSAPTKKAGSYEPDRKEKTMAPSGAALGQATQSLAYNDVM